MIIVYRLEPFCRDGYQMGVCCGFQDHRPQSNSKRLKRFEVPMAEKPPLSSCLLQLRCWMKRPFRERLEPMARMVPYPGRLDGPRTMGMFVLNFPDVQRP